VIVERSMHPGYLSNAYVVADSPGGTAVFVDSGAPLAPLHAFVEREGLTVTHLLTTHSHGDHVEGDGELVARYGMPIVKESIETGGLSIEALPAPGHAADGLVFVVDGEAVFTGDVLFQGSVGGSRDDFEGVRHSVMDVCMGLPKELVVYPGHTDATTIGAEWESNPFVRLWRGLDAEGDEPCRVGGEDARLVLWARDYDGGHKAWVRFPDGDAIVGGSRVERLG
jgi:hydroxyacylglutathione hydrolase